jgi:ribosome-binding factor A
MNANKPKGERILKVEQQVLGLTQDFFQRESSGLSLITVTRCEISNDMRNGTVFISVLPESKEEAAIHFAKRMRSELRKYVMKGLPVRVIPFLEVEIDYGEKNRLHIDELLRKEKATISTPSTETIDDEYDMKKTVTEDYLKSKKREAEEN